MRMKRRQLIYSDQLAEEEGGRSGILDDSEGPSLQNPMAERDEEKDQDMETAALCKERVPKDPKSEEVINDMCRMSFALGCDPKAYQGSLDRELAKWEATAEREEEEEAIMVAAGGDLQ